MAIGISLHVSDSRLHFEQKGFFFNILEKLFKWFYIKTVIVLKNTSLNKTKPTYKKVITVFFISKIQFDYNWLFDYNNHTLKILFIKRKNNKQQQFKIKYKKLDNIKY